MKQTMYSIVVQNFILIVIYQSHKQEQWMNFVP